MGDVTSDRHLQLWEINCEVHRKGLELVKPGVRCCDVVKELDAIYDVYGVRKYRTIGYGHSIGILSHYYGREAGKIALLSSSPPDSHREHGYYCNS